jgi:DnaJ-domain-containing protein 1
MAARRLVAAILLALAALAQCGCAGASRSAFLGDRHSRPPTALRLRSKNFYDVLSVSRSADEASIKRSYRKLAVKYHPVSTANNRRWPRSHARCSHRRSPPHRAPLC